MNYTISNGQTNLMEARNLKPGDIVYKPVFGEWSNETGIVRVIRNSLMTGMLTIHLEDGCNFRAFLNASIPFKPATKITKQEEQTVKPLGELDKTTVTAMASLFSYSQLKLLKESLKNELDRIMEEEKFNPSRNIEQLEQFNHKLNEWVKVNDLITKTIIYLGE